MSGLRYLPTLAWLLLSAGPARAATDLTADRTFWVVGFLLLFALALAVQVSCYHHARQRRRQLQAIRASRSRTPKGSQR